MSAKKPSFILSLCAIALCSGSLFASETPETSAASTLDLVKVFQGSPMIYSTLICMSIFSFIVWLYSLLTLRSSDMMPEEFLVKVREQILEKRFEAAITTCKQDNNFASSIIAAGVSARRHGPQVIMETMHAEGKRCGATLWQRISLLNDVVVIAPMLGLLGTVLGMFYAFYDTSRTQESITSIFDGLGIAVGTTVAGLIVAILAMIFYTTLKFRIVNLLGDVETQILAIGNTIEVDPSTNDVN